MEFRPELLAAHPAWIADYLATHCGTGPSADMARSIIHVAVASVQGREQLHPHTAEFVAARIVEYELLATIGEDSTDWMESRDSLPPIECRRIDDEIERLHGAATKVLCSELAEVVMRPGIGGVARFILDRWQPKPAR